MQKQTARSSLENEGDFEIDIEAIENGDSQTRWEEIFKLLEAAQSNTGN